MKTLDTIAVGNGADKGSSHPVKGHDYARHYDVIFTPIREQPLKLVEIGVGSGESIRTWLEYFPNAHIYGIDIVHGTNDWNTPNQVTARYQFTAGDQSDASLWKKFIADYGSGWDILVDDGSHMIWHIIPTFDFMWQHIKPGGYYCLEDMGVGSSPGSVFLREGFPTHMEFVKQLSDSAGSELFDIDSVQCFDELIIVKKKS